MNWAFEAASSVLFGQSRSCTVAIHMARNCRFGVAGLVTQPISFGALTPAPLTPAPLTFAPLTVAPLTPAPAPVLSAPLAIEAGDTARVARTASAVKATRPTFAVGTVRTALAIGVTRTAFAVRTARTAPAAGKLPDLNRDISNLYNIQD
ncbi:hypothetical protein Raf01_60220 [Rugosimonospora africana]|uniref:Uncharacterized protein n=1 Tax=Rugosimonospora africana TaxID=556532 RepID=A0A8J3QUR2_9ACTN|nr:hypothetical protein Raf01_60220 [Rugosimonospora africana]